MKRTENHTNPRYLHLIFSALLMIQLVLTSVVLYVASDTASVFLMPFAGNTYAIPGIAFVLVLLGRYVWNNGMREINSTEELFTKLEILTKIHIWEMGTGTIGHSNPAYLHTDRGQLLLFHILPW